jgi:hypothetical protein
MWDRKTLLARLAVGDIFHAVSPSAPSMICLITAMSEGTFEARTVTHQFHFTFDRQTGKGVPHREDPRFDFECTIDSVSPLPVDIHNTLLGLDRKMRLAHDSESFKLDGAERQALIFVGRFYPEHPLPLE